MSKQKEEKKTVSSGIRIKKGVSMEGSIRSFDLKDRKKRAEEKKAQKREADKSKEKKKIRLNAIAKGDKNAIPSKDMIGAKESTVDSTCENKK